MLVPNKNHHLLSKLSTQDRPIRIVILGSTGSIGTSALEIIQNNADRFEIYGLIAGSNYTLLNTQISQFKPRYAGLSCTSTCTKLELGTTKLVAGLDQICSLVQQSEVDLVLASVVGMAGLQPIISALQADKVVALANKESIVAAGPLVAEILNYGKDGGLGAIIPVDSEHSAIFQAMQGSNFADISRLILTASGGPFLSKSRDQLRDVTPEQAISHPRWNMGKKISVDSATMMNKALELIEAYWLFGLAPELIDVVIHPQSIVHSLVDYCDGSQIAQLSNPDMKGPISYALTYPGRRIPNAVKRLDLESMGSLTFMPLDNDRFPAIDIARSTIKSGSFDPAIFNSANEAAVDLFLNKKLPFNLIESVVIKGLERFGGAKCSSVLELIELDKEVRRLVQSSVYESVELR